MRPQADELSPLLLDANVLIHYEKAGILALLPLINQYIGQTHALAEIINEVNKGAVRDKGETQLNSELVSSLGIEIIPESADPKWETVQITSKGLSDNDRLCLVVAAQQGLTMVTSDKQLHFACIKNRVTVLWGLEPIALLVDHRVIGRDEAIQFVNQIRASFPGRINDKIVAAFRRRITPDHYPSNPLQPPG